MPEDPKILSPKAQGIGKYFGPVKDADLAACELKATTDLSDEVIAAKAGLPDAASVDRAVRLPQMQGYLSTYLDEAGATMEKSAKVIAGAHEAMDIRLTKDGDVVEVGPDHKIRLDAATLNLKARGELKENAGTRNLFVGLSDEQLLAIATGQIEAASLIHRGERIEQAQATERQERPAE